MILLISLCVLSFCPMHVELASTDYNFDQIAKVWVMLNQVPANWTDARLKCFKEGAVLASPDDENLLAAMKTVLDNSQTMVKQGIFTGTHATYSVNKDYYSVKGTPLSRMPVVWAPGEPNNAGNKENCLLMMPTGALADVDCSLAYPYICYRKDNPMALATSCGGTVGYTFNQRTRKCYKLHTELADWANAFAACARNEAHLAIINSATESQVLKELCDKHISKDCDCDVVFIGHIEWEEHGLWMTIHGETLKKAGFDTWSNGEPNHVKEKACISERCGGMYRKNGLLDDLLCSKLRPFICEKEPNI